jgi:hypothetical protein
MYKISILLQTEPLENLYEFGNLGLIPTTLDLNILHTNKTDILISNNTQKVSCNKMIEKKNFLSSKVNSI